MLRQGESLEKISNKFQIPKEDINKILKCMKGGKKKTKKHHLQRRLF